VEHRLGRVQGRVSEASAPISGPTRRERRQAARELTRSAGAWYPRWFWPSFAVPGTLWLILFFILPFYTIIAVAFGTIDIFRKPVPIWQPWFWSTKYVSSVWDTLYGSNAFLQPTFIRTFEYVAIASALCLTIGYAVAYYTARHAGRYRTLILILLISPFWISYLMRMVAWQNLLAGDGYVNRILQKLHFISAPYPWLEGKSITVILGLVYGYIPYMILPLFGFLDRIQSSLLEAGRDLGASPGRTFWRVTLPLSKPAIYAGLVIVSLPMFGDYYTQDLLSGSGKTSMIGNIIDDTVRSTPKGSVLVLLLMILLIVPMMYYLRSTLKAQESR
jgi:ABC-type spermidine/putrescine transport system permease subunit I